MDVLLILGIVVFVGSLIAFIVFKNKINKRKADLLAKEEEINQNKKIANSSPDIYKNRLNDEMQQINADISSSKQNIKSLANSIEMEKRANYMKNVFLTNVSNEIRNPLNGIMGFANILRTDLAKLNRDDLYEYADSISQSGESLLKLLSDIIEISRLEVNDVSFNLVPCDLESIIKKSVENHAKTANDKGIQIIVDDNLKHFVLSDEEVIQRVFDSVIDNAIKFTDKGYIKLSVIKKHEEGILKVNIKDTGIGIDHSYLPLVFEPYRQESLGYTTKYQGAGLSLPLAKKALNVMGCDILIESEKGIGTEVSIILKLTDKHEKAATKKPVAKTETKSEQPPWYKKNIFLVEDDKINQILFTKLLKGCDNLIISGSGEEALENLRILKEKEFTIDFVLMDINLPGEWDGIKLMHHIKENWEILANTPFIAQTAYAMSNERDLLLAEGFDEYLSKPIKRSELANSIRKVLYERNKVQ